MWGVTSADDAGWILDRLAPTPIGHFKDPVRRANIAAEQIPRAFVRFLQFANPVFDRHASMAQQNRLWCYRELAAPHHAPITVPHAVANLLLELAA
jgi:hypothetical protein